MANEIIKRDQNHITVLAGITDDVDQEVKMLRVDPITKRLLLSADSSGFSFIRTDGTSVTTASIPFAQGISVASTKIAYVGGVSDATAFGKIYNDTTTFWVQGLATSVTRAGVHVRIQGGDGQAPDQPGGMTYLKGGVYGVGGDLIQNGFTATGTSIASFNASNNIGGSLLVGNDVADFAVGATFYASGNAIFASGIGTGGKVNATGYTLIGTGQTAQIIGLDRKNGGGTNTGVSLTIHGGWAAVGTNNVNGGDLILAGGVPTGNGVSNSILKAYGGGNSGTSDGSATTVLTASFDRATFSVQVVGPVSALTSTSNSIAWNLIAAQIATHTATENTTLANPTNLIQGAKYELIWTQHASSPKTLAFGTKYKWSNGVVPTVTAVNGAVDIFQFTCDGTNMYGTFKPAFA